MKAQGKGSHCPHGVYRLTGRKINIYHKADQRCVSSKGYKYHEDEINSGRSGKISTRVRHQLGQDLEKIIRGHAQIPNKHGAHPDGDIQAGECLLHLRVEMGSYLLQEWAGNTGWPGAKGGWR